MKVEENKPRELLRSGVATMSLVSFNPDRSELEDLYPDKTIEYDPLYSKTDSKGRKTCCPSFYLLSEEHPQLLLKAQFNLIAVPEKTSNGQKVKVIDRYGRTAWVTFQQYKNRAVPVYRDGPAHIDEDYRLCYVGEERLTRFLRVLLRIPQVEKPDPNDESGWSLISHPDDALIRIEDIDAMFDGDFSWIEKLLQRADKAAVKALIGVRTAEDGTQKQCLLLSHFARPSSQGFDRWAEAARHDYDYRIGAWRDYYIIGQLQIVSASTVSRVIAERARKRESLTLKQTASSLNAEERRNTFKIKGK